MDFGQRHPARSQRVSQGELTRGGRAGRRPAHVMDNAGMPRALCAAAPLLSAVVLFYLGSRERLGYDSFWHVFVARQDNWSQFWFEVADNAHPPLFYLVLKAATLIGRGLLVYRLPSIAAIVVSA